MTKARNRSLAAVLSLALVLAASCDSKKASTPSDFMIDNSQTRIVNDIRDPGKADFDSVVEILKFTYDTSQPALDATNHLNPEIEAINRNLNETVGSFYSTFMQNPDEDWVEIRALPFCDENYLQLVSFWNRYPSYGSDGEIVSWNFDRKANKYMKLEDMLEADRLSQEKIEVMVTSTFTIADPDAYASSVQTKGFLIRSAGATEYRMYLLDILVTSPGAGEWSSFYCYEPESGKLTQFFLWIYSDDCQPDHMDPPLGFQK